MLDLKVNNNYKRRAVFKTRRWFRICNICKSEQLEIRLWNLEINEKLKKKQEKGDRWDVILEPNAPSDLRASPFLYW